MKDDKKIRTEGAPKYALCSCYWETGVANWAGMLSNCGAKGNKCIYIYFFATIICGFLYGVHSQLIVM